MAGMTGTRSTQITLGTPMEGAASGYLWTHNDPAYRNIQFGQNRRYGKGKLRGAAYDSLNFVSGLVLRMGTW